MSKLIDSLDLVVFGLVLLFVAWVLGTGQGSLSDERDAAIADLEGARAQLATALQERSYDQDAGAEVLEQARRVPAKVKAAWWPETETRKLDPGIFRHEASLRDLLEGRDLALRFTAPVDLVADAVPGSIRIAWARPEGDTVEASGYRLYRRVEGGEEELLANTSGEQLRYEDKDVVPGQVYRYQVAAVTRDPAMARLGRGESPRSAPTELRAARDFGVEPRSLAEDGQSARFMVKKLVGGVWYEKEFSAALGEEVGAADPGSGVDYASHCRFLRVENDVRTIPEERDEVVFDAEGRVLLEAGKPMTRRVAWERRIETRYAVVMNELGREERLAFATP